MPDIREIRNRARRVVHERRKIPAFYIDRPGGIPRPVDVRTLTKFNATRMPADVAAYLETQPKIIMMIDDYRALSVQTKAIISVAEGEAYVVRAVQPPDGIEVTLLVSQLDRQQTEGLPVPQ